MHWCSCQHPAKIREGVYMHARGDSAAGGGWVLREYFGLVANRRKLTCDGKAAADRVSSIPLTLAKSAAATLAKLTAAAAANPDLIDLVCSVADRELMVGDIFDVLRLLPADSTLMFTARRRVPIDATWDEAEGLMWLEQLLAFQSRGGSGKGAGGSSSNSSAAEEEEEEEEQGDGAFNDSDEDDKAQPVLMKRLADGTLACLTREDFRRAGAFLLPLANSDHIALNTTGSYKFGNGAMEGRLIRAMEQANGGLAAASGGRILNKSASARGCSVTYHKGPLKGKPVRGFMGLVYVLVIPGTWKAQPGWVLMEGDAVKEEASPVSSSSSASAAVSSSSSASSRPLLRFPLPPALTSSRQAPAANGVFWLSERPAGPLTSEVARGLAKRYFDGAKLRRTWWKARRLPSTSSSSSSSAAAAAAAPASSSSSSSGRTGVGSLSGWVVRPRRTDPSPLSVSASSVIVPNSPSAASASTASFSAAAAASAGRESWPDLNSSTDSMSSLPPHQLSYSAISSSGHGASTGGPTDFSSFSFGRGGTAAVPAPGSAPQGTSNLSAPAPRRVGSSSMASAAAPKVVKRPLSVGASAGHSGSASFISNGPPAKLSVAARPPPPASSTGPSASIDDLRLAPRPSASASASASAAAAAVAGSSQQQRPRVSSASVGHGAGSSSVIDMTGDVDSDEDDGPISTQRVMKKR